MSHTIPLTNNNKGYCVFPGVFFFYMKEFYSWTYLHDKYLITIFLLIPFLLLCLFNSSVSLDKVCTVGSATESPLEKKKKK